jgi:hypothetical protein
MSRIPNVVDRLRKAEAAVDAAELATDLRGAGFVLAFWASADGPETDSPRPVTGVGRLPDLAARLRVEPAMLERIFDIDAEGVVLIVPRRALGGSKTTAVTEAAHLIVAARQGLGQEEWTATEVVRAACDQLGILDGNFGRAIQQLHGEGFRIRGNGAKRELKMNATGYEVTTILIQSLATQVS